MKLYLVSLGCAKNLIDSEMMLGQLMAAGWTITQDPAQADVIVINTCGFIEAAINESVDTILEMAMFKEHGACQNLIVAGCLPQRFGEEIAQSLPEVDAFLGTGAFDRIAHVAKIGGLQKKQALETRCFLPDPDSVPITVPDGPRAYSSPHIAYLKIAEGCSRHCTYCIIPKLRGKQRSRPLENIVAEARFLVESGVKELILVAQDTTGYGKDLAVSSKSSRTDLGRLLEHISDISEDIWIRFLYGHPDSIDDALIRTVAERQNICTYFDIPIQHASGKVLKNMGRNYSAEDLDKLFGKIRSSDPDVALRTTVIVGFPGETDKDFEQLLRFAQDVRFNHLGVFTYSDSEDLPSHRLLNHVPKDVAAQRYDRLMSCQSEISLENNQKHQGKVLEVLVEEKPEPDRFAGRASFQAPEVDGITYIHIPEDAGASGPLRIGTFASVKITDALEYDLIGQMSS